MLRVEEIKAAADGFVAAALLGEGWQTALTRLAQAAGARDAVLMRNSTVRTIVAVPTEECADAVADYVAGRVPPSSRHARVKSALGKGFRVDHDDYTDEELARDPFYQEFLRSNGVFWHANAVLASMDGDHVELSLKRRIRAGPYQRGDAASLDEVLPELRAAAQLAKITLDAEAHGMKGVLLTRGHPVFELDARGEVLPDRFTSDLHPAHPLRLAGRNLLAVDPSAQPALDRALASALATHPRPAVAMLPAPDGRRCFLQVVPVPAGKARDVFRSAAALAVLIEGSRPKSGLPLYRSVIRDALALTGREADVACLLTEGHDLRAIARRLDVGLGTVRTHLKGLFEKTGTSRQAELVGLLSRLRP